MQIVWLWKLNMKGTCIAFKVLKVMEIIGFPIKIQQMDLRKISWLK